MIGLKRWAWGIFMGLGMLLALWSCDLTGSASPRKTYISVVVPDSLERFNKVVVVAVNPGGKDTLDVLWKDSLSNPDKLLKVETSNYHGGDVDIVIEGYLGGVMVYKRLIKFRGAQTAPEIDTLVPAPAPKDSVKPVLIMLGSDSLAITEGEAFVEPGIACHDSVGGMDKALNVIVTGRVNPSIAGIDTLIYDCADSAGNRAISKMRRVYVTLPPDTVRPEITLKGKDTLFVVVNSTFEDPGATCLDARDGVLSVLVAGGVDVKSSGTYTLHYNCRDKAGNQAEEKLRGVHVIKSLDSIAPVLTLSGSASMTLLKGHSFVDPGADCQDNHDGNVTVTVSGSVDASKVGKDTLTYTCADSAGNSAAPKTRVVEILLPPDTLAPVVTLKGKDSLDIIVGDSYVDSGSTCLDERDGILQVTVKGSVDTSKAGNYKIEYSCADKAGNADTLSRTVVVRPAPTIFPVEKESQIDTSATAPNANNGYSGTLGIPANSGDKYVSFVKFDLTKVAKVGIKSAKIRYYTYGGGTRWTNDLMPLTFRVYRMKSSWVEGTGNWYYHDGAWQNTGQELFVNYGLSNAVKAQSTNPVPPNGVAPSDKAIVRPANLALVNTDSLNVRYSDKHVAGPIVAPADLVVVDVDVTDYVKTVDPAQDFGFVVTVEGVPAGKLIGYLTKELSDGYYCPKLVVSY